MAFVAIYRCCMNYIDLSIKSGVEEQDQQSCEQTLEDNSVSKPEVFLHRQPKPYSVVWIAVAAGAVAALIGLSLVSFAITNRDTNRPKPALFYSN